MAQNAGIFILLFISTAIALTILDRNKLGPYEAIFQYMERCNSEPEYAIPFFYRLKKLSRDKFSVTGNATLPYTVSDDSFTGILQVSKFDSGAWRPNFLKFTLKNLCSLYLKRVPTLFKKMAEDSSIPIKCPIPKGNLYLNNFTINTSDFKPPSQVAVYGRFKGEITMKRGRHTIACMRFFIEIIPKISGH